MYFKFAVSSLLTQMIYLPAIIKIIYYDKVFCWMQASIKNDSSNSKSVIFV